MYMPMWLQAFILRHPLLQRILFRFRCPAGSVSARKCINVGNCGCDNASLKWWQI